MKSKLHTYVTVTISNYKAVFTYTINVVAATNHTDEPVVCGPWVHPQDGWLCSNATHAGTHARHANTMGTISHC